ncbi:hypothetical protein CC2G_011083 [Coprinopsis cinerea AmutBmut pab1-1]|nr:hypothetical protein CC2G_011074 [Coprinopsis cinerea AmutBmut pab1-1]KAG2014248.1 hypothetical protein CC2G_011083 [Coprinopsis cinerea AmutBmut pab1-1]
MTGSQPERDLEVGDYYRNPWVVIDDESYKFRKPQGKLNTTFVVFYGRLMGLFLSKDHAVQQVVDFANSRYQVYATQEEGLNAWKESLRVGTWGPLQCAVRKVSTPFEGHIVSHKDARLYREPFATRLCTLLSRIMAELQLREWDSARLKVEPSANSLEPYGRTPLGHTLKATPSMRPTWKRTTALKVTPNAVERRFDLDPLRRTDGWQSNSKHRNSSVDLGLSWNPTRQAKPRAQQPPSNVSDPFRRMGNPSGSDSDISKVSESSPSTLSSAVHLEAADLNLEDSQTSNSFELVFPLAPAASSGNSQCGWEKQSETRCVPYKPQGSAQRFVLTHCYLRSFARSSSLGESIALSGTSLSLSYNPDGVSGVSLSSGSSNGIAGGQVVINSILDLSPPTFMGTDTTYYKPPTEVPQVDESNIWCAVLSGARPGVYRGVQQARHWGINGGADCTTRESEGWMEFFVSPELACVHFARAFMQGLVPSNSEPS